MVYSAEKLLEAMDTRLTASPRIPLSHMAQELGVSRRTIERLLRMTRNMSYRSYQQSVLLRIALERLRHDKNVTIKEIALSLGYSSSADFARFIPIQSRRVPLQVQAPSRIPCPIMQTFGTFCIVLARSACLFSLIALF